MDPIPKPWPMLPSAINDLARKYMASLNARMIASEIKARGNAAKAAKPRKKRR